MCVLIHLQKIILLIAVVVSQALGGSSCCCLSRVLLSAMIASVDASPSSVRSKTEKVSTCCACNSRSATTRYAKTARYTSQSQAGENLLPDNKCSCVKHLSLAMQERPRSNVKAFESTFVVVNESHLRCVEALGPMGPSTHQPNFQRSRQHSWQAIACVWLK